MLFFWGCLLILINVEETKFKVTVNYNSNQWAWRAKFYLLSTQNFVIIEMNGHFFSWITGKEFVRDTLKALEIVQATFKCISPFFTDDNLITTLCSFHIQHHQLIVSLLIDLILNLKPYIMIIQWTHVDQYLSSATWIRFFLYAICVSTYWRGFRTPATSKMDDFVILDNTFPKKNGHCTTQWW